MRDYRDETGRLVSDIPIADIQATLAGGIMATGDVPSYSIRERLEIELLIRRLGLR